MEGNQGHGGVLLTGSLSGSCSAVFLQFRLTCPGVSPHTVGWAVEEDLVCCMDVAAVNKDVIGQLARQKDTEVEGRAERDRDRMTERE